MIVERTTSMRPAYPVLGVREALECRKSVRAFLETPVSFDVVRMILQAASRAPSGTNMQPWQVYVLTGAAKKELSSRVMAMRDVEPHRERPPTPYGEYAYNPEPLFEPYLSRRRGVGFALYELMGVRRGDRAASWALAGRNFAFFDAPVGMIFTIHRDLDKGSFLDYGMFIQSLMLAARELGLDTCPQAAWRHYHDVIRDALGLPETQIVLCGLALGYADPDAAANSLRAERAPVDAFTTFVSELTPRSDPTRM